GGSGQRFSIPDAFA
ncbi:hypothetical protein ACNVD4_02495, partial [Rhizobium sp. BR5]